MDGTKEIVLFVVKDGILHGHARRHQLSDAALDQFLGQLGVFQLVADGHALAGTDEFGQIGVEGVMGEARHLVTLVIAVISVCQRDA